MKQEAAELSDEDLKSLLDESISFNKSGTLAEDSPLRRIAEKECKEKGYTYTPLHLFGVQHVLFLEAAQRWIASLDKWQPIETAPKDITILGYVPDDGDYPRIGIQAMKQEYGEWGDSVYHEWSASPTHWQPLPELPKQK